jgi:CheY-like chemotaxis protein
MNFSDIKRQFVNPPRVLIVEDETIVALDLQCTLEQLGCLVVKIVSSGEESIEAARKYSPDVILMDIKLKGKIDGIKAAEIIYQRWKIPIIYISAYSDFQSLQRMNRIKNFGYLNKPFAEYELKSFLDKALSHDCPL